MQGTPPSVLTQPVFTPLCSFLICLLLFGKTCINGTQAGFHGRLLLVMFSRPLPLFPSLVIFHSRSPLEMEQHSLLPYYLQVPQNSP